MNSIEFADKDIYPSKIVCIGRNYVEHINELNNEIPDEPVIFIKPNSSITNEIHAGDKDPIHYEGEISFVIIEDQLKGVGFGLDLTKREVQSTLKAKGLPWERAKAFDRSAVFSKFINFGGGDLTMELYINRQLVQKGGYKLMLNKPDDILREVKTFLSVEDGDILMTGTPKGVGVLNAGDRFTGKIFENNKVIVEENWLVK